MHGCRAGMDCTSSGSGSMGSSSGYGSTGFDTSILEDNPGKQVLVAVLWGSSSGYGSTGFDTSILEDNPGKQVLVAGLWGPPVDNDPRDLIPPSWRTIQVNGINRIKSY